MIGSGLQPGDLTLGNLLDLRAVDADIAQLAIGELIELIDRLEVPDAVDQMAKLAAEKRRTSGTTGLVEGIIKRIRHDGVLSGFL